MLGNFNDIKNIIGKVARFDLMPKYKFFVDIGSVVTALNVKMYELFSGYNEDALSTTLFEDMNVLVEKTVNLLLTLKSTNVPEMVVKSEDALQYPKINVPKHLSISNNITLDFYADSKSVLKQLYYTWINLMFNVKTGTSRPKYYYEVDLPIYIFNKQSQQIEHRIYHECSPRMIADTNLDANSLELQEPLKLDLNVNGSMTIEFF
jgi:hypothetical protein